MVGSGGLVLNAIMLVVAWGIVSKNMEALSSSPTQKTDKQYVEYMVGSGAFISVIGALLVWQMQKSN